MNYKTTLLKILLSFAWIALVYVFILSSDGLKFDSSKWLKADQVDEINFQLLQKKFQPYENIVISFDLQKNIFNKETLHQLKLLSKELENIPNVKKVLSPLSATVLIEHDGILDKTTYGKALDNNYIKTMDELEKSFKDSQYYVKIVSKDLTKVAFVIESDTLSAQNERTIVIDKVKSIVGKYSLVLPKPMYSGDSYLNYELNNKTQNDLMKLIIIAFFVIGAISFFLGGYKKMMVVWGVNIITASATFFIIAINGHFLTSLSIALIIMVTVVGVSDAFHILEYWEFHNQKEENKSKSKLHNIYLTMKASYLPCFLTSLTSSLGFSTFVFTNIIPLYNFSIDASISILFSYMLNMLFLFSFLYIMPWNFNKSSSSIKMFNYYHSMNIKILQLIFTLVVKHSKKIIILFYTVTIFLSLSLPFARTESNFLDVFFAKKSNFYQDFIYLDKHFDGSNSFNIIIQGDVIDYFKEYNNFINLKTLVDSLKQLPQVNSVESYLLPVAMVHKSLSNGRGLYPRNAEELGQELLFLDMSRSDTDSGALSSYVDFNYKLAHIKLQTNNLNKTNIDVLLAEIKKIVGVSPFKEAIITGNNAYFSSISQDVLDTQFISIASCMFIVFIVLLVFFNLKFAIYGTVSASMPIVFILAIIILSQTPFDFAVVIVSSVALGLSVDNVLHVLFNYKRFQRSHLSVDEKLKQALFIPGVAIIQATLLFVITTLIFVFSDLVLLQKFGFFTSLTLLLSFLTCTVFFLALLRNSNKSLGKQT